MKILIAPDSFKESLTASEVGLAMAEALCELFPNATLEVLPLSDGGEGAFELFSTLKLGSLNYCKTCDPLGRPLRAPYFGFKDSKTAWIELSQASGLALLKPAEQNPLKTSTYGTGLQILHALEQGFTDIVLGIGGSATNDLALGIFTALGGRIFDGKNNTLKACGAALLDCTSLDLTKLTSLLEKASITVACDVTNSLLGKNGASHTYAAQKGASQEDIEKLEAGGKNLAELIKKETGRSITDVAGGGAAGGTAAGMYGIFNSKLEPGFDLLSQLTRLEEKVKSADMIFTGEGRTDNQSKNGKAPLKLAQLAQTYNKPLYLFSGSITLKNHELHKAGITAGYAIKTASMSLEFARQNAYDLIKNTIKEKIKAHL